ISISSWMYTLGLVTGATYRSARASPRREELAAAATRALDRVRGLAVDAERRGDERVAPGQRPTEREDDRADGCEHVVARARERHGRSSRRVRRRGARCRGRGRRGCGGRGGRGRGSLHVAGDDRDRADGTGVDVAVLEGAGLRELERERRARRERVGRERAVGRGHRVRSRALVRPHDDRSRGHVDRGRGEAGVRDRDGDRRRRRGHASRRRGRGRRRDRRDGRERREHRDDAEREHPREREHARATNPTHLDPPPVGAARRPPAAATLSPARERCPCGPGPSPERAPCSPRILLRPRRFRAALTGGRVDGTGGGGQVVDASRRRLTSLADVARRAGVSVTTASRVMSASSHPVAERTRRKVIQAAEELDFEPNLVARGLVAQRTSIVGLLVGDVADPAAALVVRGAEDVAFEHGFSVLVADTDGDPDKELAYVRKLRALRADAVILAGSSVAGNGGLDELARQLQLVEEANGVIVRLVPEPGIAADVTWSRDDAYRLLLEHLVALGHETFALVTGPPSRATDAAVAACTAAARAFGADLRPEHVIAVDDAPERAGAIADPLVCVGPTPTAVLAASDAIAAGVA